MAPANMVKDEGYLFCWKISRGKKRRSRDKRRGRRAKAAVPFDDNKRSQKLIRHFWPTNVQYIPVLELEVSTWTWITKLGRSLDDLSKSDQVQIRFSWLKQKKKFLKIAGDLRDRDLNFDPLPLDSQNCTNRFLDRVSGFYRLISRQIGTI